MPDRRDVQLKSTGGEVTLEVVVTNQKPAGITVSLYGADRRKERDIGSAVTLEPPDPDVFDIASATDVGKLHTKILATFVSIGSFEGVGEEPVSVICTLRQGGNAIVNGTIVAPRVVKAGGAGAIITYNITVA